MKRLAVLLLLLSFSVAYAETIMTGRTFDCTLESVHDGDTIIVKEVIYHKIRLIDVWAPELNTPDGPKAKSELEELLKGTLKVTLPVVGSTPSKTQTFDRVAGYVYVDDKCINDVLNAKYPRPKGKKKPEVGK